MSRLLYSWRFMETTGEKIRTLREQNNMPLRKLAALLDIDQSTLSKIERNERQANKELIEKVSEIFKVNKDDLIISFYSDKVIYELKNEKLSQEILKVAEQKVEYFKRMKDNEQ